MPFDDNIFDLGITWTVVQYIPPETIRESMKKIRRVMKDDSVLVMCKGMVKSAQRGESYWAPKNVFPRASRNTTIYLDIPNYRDRKREACMTLTL